MRGSPAAGDPAPGFTLEGTDCEDCAGPQEAQRARCRDGEYSLASQQGRVTVLVFYPGDATPVCTVQLRSYSREFGRFDGLGAAVWAISPQGVESHKEFACQEGGFKFPLLADTDKAVGRAYGILGPVGFYRRSVFVIDAKGIVRYAHRSMAGTTFRPTDELVEAVRASL